MGTRSRAKEWDVKDLGGELWKEIEGHANYLISSKGRIKSKARWIDSGKGYSRFWKARILTPSVDGQGEYLCVNLEKNGYWVHRLVAKAFLPIEEGKEFVNHKDFDKYNNSVENLEWVTAKENTKYSFDRGRFLQIIGSNNHFAKLSEEEVSSILKLIANKELTNVEIAQRFNVTRGVVEQIRKGIIWKHVARPQGVHNIFPERQPIEGFPNYYSDGINVWSTKWAGVWKRRKFDGGRIQLFDKVGQRVRLTLDQIRERIGKNGH